MAVFAGVPGATVIVKRAGIYRQADVFRYDGRVFAKVGSGFIALHRDGDTSAPKTSWESLEGVRTTHVLGKTTLYFGGEE